MSLLSLAVAVSLLAPSTNVRVSDPFAARLVRDAALAASRKLATASKVIPAARIRLKMRVIMLCRLTLY